MEKEFRLHVRDEDIGRYWPVIENYSLKGDVCMWSREEYRHGTLPMWRIVIVCSEKTFAKIREEVRHR